MTRSWSDTGRRSRISWGVCCTLAGLVFLTYSLTSLAAGRGEFVMPLDDVYIHFQYAKQLASGQPYVYNPGDPPTSGATSFLYPYVLAAGYLLGFKGLNLGLWAMMVGALALAGSTWFVYHIGKSLDVPDWLALLVAVIFALSGPVSWHFMSGMETGLMMLFTLGTLYFLLPSHDPLALQGAGPIRRVRQGAIAAALMALTRPEGGIMALIAVGAMLVIASRPNPLSTNGVRKTIWSPRRQMLWLLIPMLASGVQPLVNLLLTGSALATGNQAKSLLGLVPPDTNYIAGRIAENFVRMWREILVPGELLQPSSLGVWGLGIPALVGCVILLKRRDWRLAGVVIVLWVLAGSLALATLDTAFWHFKRYQMPLIALLYPLVIPTALTVWRTLIESGRRLGYTWGLPEALSLAAALSVVASVVTSVSFWQRYLLNVNLVYSQPLQMARWLAANTPSDATVAVHDVGLIRYIGERTTIDMVGLTTPGAAEYWRNGPGAVAEFLIRKRPDYIAAYTDARGLSYLADTGIYGQLLAGFQTHYDETINVALAGHFQGIYRPDWSAADNANSVLQPGVRQYLDGLDLVDSVNVGDLESEGAHDYRWRNAVTLPGFPSEVYQQNYLRCAIDDCTTLDGGRRINGEESFTLTTRPNQDLVLVTRLHPLNPGRYDVYVNGTLIDTNWIPEIPGNWLEVATLIRAKYVTSTETHIRIVPTVPNGHYMPYYHWAWQGTYGMARFSITAMCSGFQNGAIAVCTSAPSLLVESQMPHFYLHVIFGSVRGDAQGDYKFFVHIYRDASRPPVAQIDTYTLGTELPGNWLPGRFGDIISLDLPDLDPGRYQVAIGMYDPTTNERLKPDSGGDEFGRLFIGEVEIR